ncbi:hypothetical protein Hanom_Chr14g01303091 [Helianthus anomalus]
MLFNDSKFKRTTVFNYSLIIFFVIIIIVVIVICGIYLNPLETTFQRNIIYNVVIIPAPALIHVVQQRLVRFGRLLLQKQANSMINYLINYSLVFKTFIEPFLSGHKEFFKLGFWCHLLRR